MSIFQVKFEEIPVTIDGQCFFATFDCDFTYTTTGHMRHCRVDEIETKSTKITLLLTNEDGDRVNDHEARIPPRTDLSKQIVAAISRDEDRIRRKADEDLHEEWVDYCDRCRG